jgi:hypothetical protein
VQGEDQRMDGPGRPILSARSPKNTGDTPYKPILCSDGDVDQLQPASHCDLATTVDK